jgi:integrase
LRASELTGAKVSDLTSDDDGMNCLRLVQGKGRKDRMIPLSPDVAQVMQEYIAQRKAKRDDYLFDSRQGETGRLTAARVWQIITSAVTNGGIIVARQHPPTAKGFAFLAVEDSDGMVNVVVSLDVYAQCRAAIHAAFVIIEGVVQKDHGATPHCAHAVGASVNMIARQVSEV